MIMRRALVSTMLQLTNSEAENYPSGECLSIMSEAVENATSECWTGEPLLPECFAEPCSW